MIDSSNKDLENIVLAHRYLYYVLMTPILPDYTYDSLEEYALTKVSEDSIIRFPGSNLEEDYSDEIKELANKLLSEIK